MNLHRNSDLLECGVDEYAWLNEEPKRKATKKEVVETPND